MLISEVYKATLTWFRDSHCGKQLKEATRGITCHGEAGSKLIELMWPVLYALVEHYPTSPDARVAGNASSGDRPPSPTYFTD